MDRSRHREGYFSEIGQLTTEMRGRGYGRERGITVRIGRCPKKRAILRLLLHTVTVARGAGQVVALEVGGSSPLAHPL